MKTKDIKKDTDYAVGMERKLWYGVEYAIRNDYDLDTHVPYDITHIRVIDNRPHKQSSWGSRNNEPRLVEEGEKPNRSYYNVGPLAVGIKRDGTESDPFVIRPQDVRMEWDAWRTEYKRRALLAHDRQKAATKEREAKEEAEKVAANARRGVVQKLNGLLEGSGVTAKEIDVSVSQITREVRKEVVLTGGWADLLQLAEAGHTVPGTVR